MVTILFHSTIFGPINSRRLGTSLGINLSPTDGKICSFDCIYCEAGYNAQGTGVTGFPKREEVKRLLEEKLAEMTAKGERLDVITFSGNGEPTLHPDFAGVIDDTLALRDRYFPKVKVSVLCNSTRLHKSEVVDALLRVDNNILKLDSGITDTMRLIDQPCSPEFTIERLLPQLEAIGEKCIIQTMMLRGSHNGKTVDNTTEDEIAALESAYLRIKPREVMLYSIDRATPESDLQKVSREELEQIAERWRKAGVIVQVS